MKHFGGVDIPTTLDDLCNRQRMALLVYDMQVGICSQIEDGNQVVEQVARVLSAARKSGLRVVLAAPKDFRDGDYSFDKPGP